MSPQWGHGRSVRFAALLLLAALAACGGSKPAAPAHDDDGYEAVTSRAKSSNTST
jgi:ABC-type glycerol-3-phosphate transport system substrate-binding protein